MQMVLPLRQLSRSPLNPVKQSEPHSFTAGISTVKRWELQVKAYLYYRANRQSNSCQCKSRWLARWGAESRCYQLRGNWQEPPDAWLERTGSGGPCSVYLRKVKRFHVWAVVHNHWQTLMLPKDTGSEAGRPVTRWKSCQDEGRSQKVECGRLDVMTLCGFSRDPTHWRKFEVLKKGNTMWRGVLWVYFNQNYVRFPSHTGSGLVWFAVFLFLCKK